MTKLSPGDKGAIRELKVAMQLMEEGYDVFRALSPHTKCDLVAVKGSEVLRVEVRSGVVYRDGMIWVSLDKKDPDSFDLLVGVAEIDSNLSFNYAPKIVGRKYDG